MTREEIIQMRQFHDQNLCAGLEWIKDDNILDAATQLIARMRELLSKQEDRTFTLNYWEMSTLYQLSQLGLCLLIDKRFGNHE